jgi:hypothetical protein
MHCISHALFPAYPLLFLLRSDGSGAELGLNLAGLADWGTEQPYVDFGRVSREWNPQSAGLQSQSWTWGAVPDTLDDAGYATELPDGVQLGTMMVRDLQGERLCHVRRVQRCPCPL